MTDGESSRSNVTFALEGITMCRHGPADVLVRVENGEVVDPARYYFRTTPQFETAAPRYDWINRVLAIGIGHRSADGVVYSIFEVL